MVFVPRAAQKLVRPQMDNWTELYAAISEHTRLLRREGCDIPFFRGHANNSWELRPELGRGKRTLEERETIERRMYYDFISLSGPLLPHSGSSWNTLFTMQHHGLPTRLLDWTLSFATAVFFALNGNDRTPKDACVWVLNPFLLNKITCSDDVILTPPDDFEGSYYENYITREKSLGHSAVAINPIRVNARQVAQESAFTLSGDLTKPLDELAPDALKKFSLVRSAQDEAREFVELAGVNSHRLFPDLDGVARHIRDRQWK